LVLLCFECHNLAGLKGNIAKKPSIATIKKYRDEHYETVRIKIEQNRKRASSTLDGEGFFDNITSAIALIEVKKIISEIQDSEINDKLINKIHIYFEFLSFPMAFEIANFCSYISNEYTYEKAESASDEIFGFATIMLDAPTLVKNEELILELFNQFLGCAYSIIYNSISRNNNFRALCYGMQTLKYIRKKASNRGNQILINNVNRHYQDVKGIIESFSKTTNYSNLVVLYSGFIEDLENDSLAFPAFDKSMVRNYNGNKIDLEK
jgi:hypothetical protein